MRTIKDVKVGDVVVCTNGEGWHYETGDKLEVIKYQDSLDRGSVGINKIEEYPQDFELVEKEPSFNLKTQPWYIMTGDAEKSKVVQEWLFSQGVYWAGGYKRVSNFEEKYLTNIDSEGEIDTGFMHGSGNPYSQKREEIKLTFKTVVDSVFYPDVESPAQAKIRELEESIAKMEEQGEQL